MQDEYDEAIEDFNTAIKMNPDFEEAYIGRGNAYTEIRKYTEALADFVLFSADFDPFASLWYDGVVLLRSFCRTLDR